MTDKGKAVAYPGFDHDFNLEPGSDEKSSKDDEGRAVLTFSFLGPQSYAATSYPHPIEEVQRKNENEYRDIAISKSVPASLFQYIETRVERELQSANPKNRCFSLRPGCYFMHITCWQPDDNEEFENSKDGLWLVYSWTGIPGHRGRPAHRWRPGHDPAVSGNDAHPTLGRYLAHIGEHASGNISNLALGKSSSSFFIRLSADDRNWHYRFRGLPEDCLLAVQESMTADMLRDKDCRPEELSHQHCTYGLQHCKHGRLRAVTLGHGGGWIVYREEMAGVEFDTRKLPPALVKALKEGREKGWIINQAVLNPHHPLEYLLAYNNGRVYYSFHWSFENDFQRIAQQWADGKGVKFQPHPQVLTEDFYAHNFVADDVDSSPTPDSGPRSDVQQHLPRDDDLKYPASHRLSSHQVPQPTAGEWGVDGTQPQPPNHRPELGPMAFSPFMNMAQPQVSNPFMYQGLPPAQALVMQQQQQQQLQMHAQIQALQAELHQTRLSQAQLYQAQMQPSNHFLPQMQTPLSMQQQAVPAHQREPSGSSSRQHVGRVNGAADEVESDDEAGLGDRRKAHVRSKTPGHVEEGDPRILKKEKKHSWRPSWGAGKSLNPSS